MSEMPVEDNDIEMSKSQPVTVQIRNENDDQEKTDKISTKTLEIYFVDVGQGNCTLILCPGGEKILIDCGSVSAGSKETLGKPLRDFIRQHAADKLDFVLVSHPDIDHVSLLPSLLAEVKTIGTIVCGGELAEWGKGPGKAFKNYVGTLDRDFKTCLISDGKFITESPYGKPGHVVVSGGVEIRIVAVNAPREKNPKNLEKLDIVDKSLFKAGTATNTHSMVVSVRYGATQVLICGDATFSTDLAILEQTEWTAKELESYALAGGHHGSDVSYSPKWLKAVDPCWVFLGADMINKSFLHPRQVVIERILECCPRIRKSHFGPHGIVFGRSRNKDPEKFNGNLGPCAETLTFIANLRGEIKGKNQKGCWRMALCLFVQSFCKNVNVVFSLLENEPQHWLSAGLRFWLKAGTEKVKIEKILGDGVDSDENDDDDPPDLYKAFGDDIASLTFAGCELLWWFDYWALQLRRIEKEQENVKTLNFLSYKEAEKLQKEKKSKSKSKPKKTMDDEDDDDDDEIVEEISVESSDINYWEWLLTDYNLFTSLETANQGVYWLLEIEANGNCRTHRT